MAFSAALAFIMTAFVALTVYLTLIGDAEARVIGVVIVGIYVFLAGIFWMGFITDYRKRYSKKRRAKDEDAE